MAVPSIGASSSEAMYTAGVGRSGGGGASSPLLYSSKFHLFFYYLFHITYKIRKHAESIKKNISTFLGRDAGELRKSSIIHKF